MTDVHVAVQAALDDAWLTLDELCRAAAVSPDWVLTRLQEGLVEVPVTAPGRHRFDARVVHRICRMRRVELAFDAAPELAALVADLEDEMARLRARLQRLGIEDGRDDQR